MIQKKNRRNIARKRTVRNASLESIYGKFFVPSPTAFDEKSSHTGTLPSLFKPVPSVVTYGVGDEPIVVSFNA